MVVRESNSEAVKEKYLKGETEDLRQLKIWKRGNGEKSKDSLDKHRLQEVGRRVHRAQIHRRQDRRQTGRSSTIANETSARARSQISLRRRHPNLGQVGNAHSQTPNRHRR